MSFDGVMFSKVINLLKKEIVGTRINKIYQVSNNDFVFTIFSKSINSSLIVSIDNTASYISLNKDFNKDKIENNHFTTNLFHHLVNGRIEDIEQINNDRIAKLTVTKTNELGMSKTSYLYIELTGKLTNIILTKDNNIIIDCYHKIGVTADRTIATGGIYNPPFNKRNKDFFNDKYDPSIQLENQFSGQSKNLQEEIKLRLEKESFDDIRNEIISSDKLFIYDNDFHLIKLSKFENYTEMGIFEGLNYFYSKTKKLETNDGAKDLLKIITKEIKHYETKISKLQIELNKSEEFEKYKTYGDEIFNNCEDLNAKKKTITINNIEIKLDDKLSLKENALSYYKKYKKLKNSGSHIDEQINICKEQIDYLSNIKFQCENSDLNSLQQIRNELIEQKIIKQAKILNQKKQQIHLQEYDVDGVKISVGKNNLQNEYLTFKLAKYNDYFFHVKDYHGSHVIVHSPELNEKIIRYAANLAAINSQAKESSSVPVQYTIVKNVKKIPGGKPGKVLLKEYKLIYIDPKENF